MEVARALAEDLEVLERAMYAELGDPPSVRRKRPDEIARDQVVSGQAQPCAPASSAPCAPTPTARSRRARW